MEEKSDEAYLSAQERVAQVGYSTKGRWRLTILHPRSKSRGTFPLAILLKRPRLRLLKLGEIVQIDVAVPIEVQRLALGGERTGAEAGLKGRKVGEVGVAVAVEVAAGAIRIAAIRQTVAVVVQPISTGRCWVFVCIRRAAILGTRARLLRPLAHAVTTVGRAVVRKDPDTVSESHDKIRCATADDVRRLDRGWV